MSQASSSKQPSFMRYARVQAVLEQEDAFVARMGTKTEAVFKPDGEKQLFSPEVIAVTQAIHTSGKDAHKVHKTEIVKIACQVFKIGRAANAAPATNGAVVETPAPAPAPVPEPPPQPAPSVQAEKKPAKAQQKSPAKPVKPAKATPEAATAPEPPKAKEEPPKQAEAPAANSGNQVGSITVTIPLKVVPDRPGENLAAFNAYISMYSGALTLLQLVEIYDNQPGHEKRFKLLDELAKEFNKFTTLKSAKESQKT